VSRDIFISIGTPGNDQQKAVLENLKIALGAKGLRARLAAASAKTPLLNVRDLLDECVGMIVIAQPRINIIQGIERPDTEKAKKLESISLATPWNHIEAAFAYDRGLPLIVICDASVKQEGFLQYSYDWEVKYVNITPEFFKTEQLDRYIDEFEKQVENYKSGKFLRFPNPPATPRPTRTVGQLVSSLSVEGFIQIAAGVTALISTAFFAGQYFASW